MFRSCFWMKDFIKNFLNGSRFCDLASFQRLWPVFCLFACLLVISSSVYELCIWNSFLLVTGFDGIPFEIALWITNTLSHSWSGSSISGSWWKQNSFKATFLCRVHQLCSSQVSARLPSWEMTRGISVIGASDYHYHRLVWGHSSEGNS